MSGKAHALTVVALVVLCGLAVGALFSAQIVAGIRALQGSVFGSGE